MKVKYRRLLTFVGPARVYLGEHWTSDVLGGYLLGGGWVSLCLRLYLLLRGQEWQRYE